ncbi:MAG: SagB/ThcOx family dehydrogenase [candidate division WOR-3 bacterium]|nr:SagB/ThcOx family dehydrogenase [candidate division WOR-3 bacterium]MCX7837012.1 SagB/ThcOx family dehydrogenase [candidate division WOR-3 bacterium]MDW8114415.1 SagB/ThcOx family dehydrogenase [candidate division WOR-3 bacterium]
MRRLIILILLFLAFLYSEKGGKMKLPKPRYKSEVSVEEALLKRRSIRSYKKSPLTLEEVSQLLWAAYGITADWGGKTCPSAGATYPLVIYLVAGEVKDLKPGVYQYIPEEHSLKLVLEKDVRKELMMAAWQQEYILNAPINIVIAANYERTTSRYGERGIRYVHMEVGHCGQNIHLQCETMGLGTVVIGAFNDKEVKKILKINEDVLYIMPIGKKK